MNNLHAEMREWPREKVKDLVQHCLRSGFVDRQEVMKLMLHNPRSGMGERGEAVELVLTFLKSGLVDLDHLRDVWTSQLEDGEYTDPGTNLPTNNCNTDVEQRR